MHQHIMPDGILHQTPTRDIVLESYTSSILTKNICIKYDYFNDLCKKNCPNYGLKYSCPPFAPSFEKFSSAHNTAHVICYRLILDQYQDLHPFHAVRAANAVLKSIIDRELLGWKEKGYKVGGSGSCRACKPCGAKTGEPCKKPKRRIYSLEAMGVNVDRLARNCFGFELQWYRKGHPPPSYTCVVGAVLRD